MEKIKVKKKREDVSKRKETKKDTDFVCIKMSWNSLCKNNYLKRGIQEIVYNINKISFLSYKLLNFHFTRLLEEDKELPELTQNIFYNASCYVSVMKNRKTTIYIFPLLLIYKLLFANLPLFAQFYPVIQI